MTIKVHFRYQREVWSLYNKTFNIGWFVFIILALLGYSQSDVDSSKYVFVVLALIYLGFVIKTIRIWMHGRHMKKHGIKCNGVIVDKVIKKGYNRRSGNYYTIVSLLVEYENSQTGEKKRFTTTSVNGCPFTYLSSLDVTVYELPDGTAWATDFQRIKSLKDAVKYKM